MRKYSLAIPITAFFLVWTLPVYADKIDKATDLAKLFGYEQQTAQLLEEAILENPAKAKIHYRAGKVYLLIGWQNEAKRAFTNALRLDEINYRKKISVDYMKLGTKQLQEGKVTEAFTSLQTAKNLDHDLREKISEIIIESCQNSSNLYLEREFTKHISQATKPVIAMLMATLDSYRLDVNKYPTQQEGLNALLINPGNNSWDGPYLSRKELPTDFWGNSYNYINLGKGKEIAVVSYGADNQPGGNGISADIGY